MASRDQEEEEGTGGILADSADIIAQYQTTRIRAFWTGYKRIFQLTKGGAQTVDPNSFSVTNTFPYENVKISVDDKNVEQIVLEMDRTTYIYKTAHRPQLLCQLFESVTKKVPTKLPSFGPFDGQRARKNGTQADCQLFVVSFGIVEQDQYGNILQEYKWVNFSRIGTDDDARAFFFEYSGRTKIFFIQNVDRLIQVCKTQLKQLGMDSVPFLSGQNSKAILQFRLQAYSAIPAAVSTFDVNKHTRRSPRPLPRQLHISEEYVAETDASGFQFISFQPVNTIYAIVRSWDSPREFAIEYNDGSHRKYTCSIRDTLLAMLLDVCHAAGNLRVIVTGEVSDGLRLMPRFAEEDYQASMKDAFFGASSIEAWFLARLSKACKNVYTDVTAVVEACRELNSNVPCPGISPTSDVSTVKITMAGVLRTLQSEVIRAAENESLDNARGIATMLQTLFRLIPCAHGYKAFVEVKDVDSRVLLLQLLKYDNNFVNYWALEVLMMLCKCPLSPRNMQQEYVNKHTILTSKMLVHLVELMSYRVDTPDAPTEPAASVAAENEKKEGEQLIESAKVEDLTADEQVQGIDARTTTAPAPPAKKPVAPNAKGFSHIPTGSLRADRVDQEDRPSQPAAEVVASASDLVFFTPNSLVVIGAAALLESLVSSRKDTTSPELLKEVLDLLAERCDVLVGMLRSTSFLILENAAILMFCLLKNRPAVATALKEMVLCDGLVLKHFYNAVFSPSGTQRFLSRFLIATWLSGPAKANPGKALLTRMIPSGLAEFLKFAAITEEHRQNLDLLEEEFYASFANASGAGTKVARTKANSSAMQARMRKRISNALREQAVADRNAVIAVTPLPPVAEGAPSMPPPVVAPSATTNAASSGKQPENYRIMFHMMTRDHKLPDLIWNDQTRLELRSALEGELKAYDREQRLRGTQKLAWNFQQFSVRYESLREEMQVGPIYIRYFLDAGDAFLRQLENPSPLVLFEKLFRRVLVNVEFQPSLSILCSRCLLRLYEACRESIGAFDDMMIMVRMLEQASNLELQQCLLDLLVTMCQEDANLLQLLDRTFVDIMIKYVTLAHINPDQIGNVLARATNNMLLIKDGDSSNQKMPTTSAVQEFTEEESINKKLRRSMWIPDDAACPRVWFAAPPGKLPPPKQAQKGPFRVSELLDEYEKGTISKDWIVAPLSTEESDDSKFDSIVDTGRWKPVREFFQLRLQLLFPGKAMYSPAQVAAKGLRLLQRLGGVHKSSNFKGIPFFPIALSKRIMSDPSHLVVFSQLLLSNDPQVVDNAADLLRSLVEFNLTACSKLYLTGAFFFAARYTGNNYKALAQFFHATHLRQSFHDASASVARDVPLAMKSVLGVLFPAAMVCILNNYGSDRFAAVHTGDFDTPEVIWNAELRKHLVEMVEQHLGDFPSRLRQYSLGCYEYCPIPRVHYKKLDKEIYVHEYYLRNLCDEVRFPEWPIAEPLLLLREAIERWREEMSKGIVDSTIGDAKNILGLSERFDNAELRKAYKNLARQYHPDRNPNGREMFEKIQIAYELLSSVELQVMETDIRNVTLLVRTQNILYRRFPDKIGDQKYPAYKLLDEVVRVPPLGSVPSEQDAELLTACAALMFHSTDVSPLNAKEFVKCGVVPKLYALLEYALSLTTQNASASLAASIMLSVLKTCTAIANIEEGRQALLSLCPKLAEDLYAVFAMKKTSPLVVENCIEVIARCCTLEKLQTYFVEAGLVWRLVPLLLEYDGTLKDDYMDESQRVAANQCASNMHAVLAAKALGRLGGYMFDDLASPNNEPVKACVAKLLTSPLSRLLRNRRPWDLLDALNENVETATKIWNIGMRNELMEFTAKIEHSRVSGSHADDLKHAEGFGFSCLRDELCVGGVYVRIFNKTADTGDIDDPSKFCCQLLDFVAQTLAQPSLTPVQKVHLDYAAEGLKCLAESRSYVPFDLANHPSGIETVFTLLELHVDSAAFASATKLLLSLFSSPDFVLVISKRDPPVLWRMLRCLCTVSGPAMADAWTAADSFVSNADGLGALLDAGCVVRLLGVLIAVTGYVNSFQSRTGAISLLSKCLWHPVKGADAAATLRRFLPEPVVLLLRGTANNASVKVLDTVCENPELIWTAEMQTELRDKIEALLRGTSAEKDVAKGAPVYDFSIKLDLAPDYSVRYRQLENELYVGGVYIRVYLKQPTFRLSNPVLFAEKLLEFWESSFAAQVPMHNGNRGEEESMSDSRAVILGKEDFLSLLTSCIVCVVKGEPSVVDHMLSWGFVSALCDFLKAAVRTGRVGSPLVSIVRLLHQLVARVEIVESLGSSKVDVIGLLVSYLAKGDTLPKDSTVVVELLKKLFLCTYARCIWHFVDRAREADLPNVILNRILGADAKAVELVLHPSALRIYAVDVLKALLAAADEEYAAVLRALLDVHPAWREFRDQSHDLFITDKERSDLYLIQDASDKKFAGLLTDGTDVSLFSSTSTLHSKASSASSRFHARATSERQANKSSYTQAAAAPPPAPAPAPAPASAATAQPRMPASAAPPTPHAPPAHPASVAPPTPAAVAATASRPMSTPAPSASMPKAATGMITTTIKKGEHGIGLDLGKSKDNLAMVLKLKELPAGAINPAATCTVPMAAGDVITAVNGVQCTSFADTVKLIRAAEVSVTLTFTRG